MGVIAYQLYDLEVISVEGFLKWRDSDDQKEQEGKGMCLKEKLFRFLL